jgi:hypothetical protein
LSELVAGGGDASELLFDAIYFDTFAEDYKALREFFSERAVQLLDAESHMAFFNGMGADRQVCHDVYNQVWISSFSMSEAEFRYRLSRLTSSKPASKSSGKRF